jgi:hypothetical protein
MEISNSNVNINMELLARQAALNILKSEMKAATQIIAETPKESAAAKTATDFLTDALANLNIPTTENNLNLAKILMANNLPITKETLFKLNHAQKAFSENVGAEQKALFLLKNELLPNSENVRALNELCQQKSVSTPQKTSIPNATLPFEKLSESIAKLPLELKDKVIKILVNNNSNNSNKMNTDNTVKTIDLSSASFVKNTSDKIPEKQIQKTPINLSNQETGIDDVYQNDKILQEISGTNSTLAPKTRKIVYQIDNKILELDENIINKDNFHEKVNTNQNSDKIYQKENFSEKNLIKSLLLEKYLLSPELLSKNKLDEILTEFKNNLSQSKSVASSFEGNENIQKFVEIVDNTVKNMDFLQNIKTTTVIPLPIAENNSQTPAELHVFADKRKKNSSSDSVSALIALDYLNLGHVEAYVKKSGNSVNCQFRLEKEKTVSLLKQNMPILNERLSALGYNLSILYKKSGESFKITSNSFDEEEIKPKNQFFFDAKV